MARNLLELVLAVVAVKAADPACAGAEARRRPSGSVLSECDMCGRWTRGRECVCRVESVAGGQRRRSEGTGRNKNRDRGGEGGAWGVTHGVEGRRRQAERGHGWRGEGSRASARGRRSEQRAAKRSAGMLEEWEKVVVRWGEGKELGAESAQKASKASSRLFIFSSVFRQRQHFGR